VSALFITATGTDIGKTFITAGLLGWLRRAGVAVDALKPVMSGYDPAEPAASDGGVLLAAMGYDPTPEAIARIAPLRFAAPLAPDMAARAEGRALHLDELLTLCRARIAETHRPLVIEGVGGVMSPVAEDATGLDLLAALGCPAVLVAGSYLGTISHTLTAAAVLAQRGVTLRAIVVNESADSSVPLRDTREAIARFLPDVPVLTCPRGAGIDAGVFSELAGACGLGT
jgi:dethiobiotin synthetase